MGRSKKCKNLTLDQFVSLEYLPYIRSRLKSWSTAERLLRCHVSPVFGHRKLSEISRLDIQRWQRDMLMNGFSMGTVDRSLSALQALCTYAELLGYLPLGMSPCYKIARFPREKRTAYIAPPDKIAEMFEVLDKSDTLAARALQLMILTDARKNEILLAQWTDIDWHNGTLRSIRATHGAARMISLPEEAIAILKEMHANSDSNWVFPGRKEGQPLSDIYHFWNSLRKNMGLAQMRIDDLRYNMLPGRA